MLKQNGIAYIVREQACGWQHDQPGKFMDEARRRFVDVIEVAGPAQLGSPWDWPLDDGARQWDDKLDELARSFRSLYLANKTAAASTIFIYSYWAVAVALGARLTAADRTLELGVGQRPSDARAGKVSPDLWVHSPQSFTTAQLVPSAMQHPGSGEVTSSLRLTFTGRRKVGKAHPPAEVSLLLLRFGRQDWTLPERIIDRAGLGLAGTLRDAHLHELRCMPPGDGRFAWEDYPALAVAAADWIERKAAELAGHTLLLGAIMPQEVGLGLGLCAGQAKRTNWPGCLWPLMFQNKTDSYVVPHLNLGTAKMPGRA